MFTQMTLESVTNNPLTWVKGACSLQEVKMLKIPGSVSTCCKQCLIVFSHLSRDMTKPTKWLCAQRRLRSAWAPSLVRVFAVRLKKAWVLSCPLSAQQRLWSDWADAQADLSLRWAHSHFVFWGSMLTKLQWLHNNLTSWINYPKGLWLQHLWIIIYLVSRKGYPSLTVYIDAKSFEVLQDIRQTDWNFLQDRTNICRTEKSSALIYHNILSIKCKPECSLDNN